MWLPFYLSAGFSGGMFWSFGEKVLLSSGLVSFPFFFGGGNWRGFSKILKNILNILQIKLVLQKTSFLFLTSQSCVCFFWISDSWNDRFWSRSCFPPWTVGQVFVAFDGLSPQLVSHQDLQIRGPPTLLLAKNHSCSGWCFLLWMACKSSSSLRIDILTVGKLRYQFEEVTQVHWFWNKQKNPTKNSFNFKPLKVTMCLSKMGLIWEEYSQVYGSSRKIMEPLWPVLLFAAVHVFIVFNVASVNSALVWIKEMMGFPNDSTW